MRKLCCLLFLSLCLAVPAWGVSPFPVPQQSILSESTVGIGELAQLSISPLEKPSAALVAVTAVWRVIDTTPGSQNVGKEKSLVRVAGGTALNPGSVIFAAGVQKCRFSVTCAVTYLFVEKDAKTSQVSTVHAETVFLTKDIHVGEAPAPDPNPGPNPGPGPGPKPVFAKAWLVVIEETSQAGGSRGAFFRDKDLLNFFLDKSWQFRVADKDVVDATGSPPADLKPWLERAKGKQLPWMFLVSDRGDLLLDEAIPATPQALLEKLKKVAQ
jgi:hypothetical protein